MSWLCCAVGLAEVRGELDLAADWPRPGIAVLLTGMGSDGAKGLFHLRQVGWHTITQDRASCVVYGMPKVAFEIGAVERQLPLHRIGSSWTRR